MANKKAGKVIEVVSPGPDHSFELKLEALEALLGGEDVKDRAVVLVSVAGAYRNGKSFLLNFFLRYLQHTYNGDGSGDWLGNDDTPLQGFSWCSGSERVTSGLLLWSEPYKATLSSGEEVVILVMDTQGTFDCNSTMHDNSRVFGLSTLLSSVQVYNLFRIIGEADLQNLQLFTNYGKMALSNSKDETKPFQRLQFLVRDWSFTDNYAYGAAGGQELLNKQLKTPEGLDEELLMVRQNMVACFEELACFLMPSPGGNVSTKQFTGKLAAISPEFKESLRQLVPMLLAPKNLVPRRIQGEVVRARDLVHYFKSYMKYFDDPSTPKPTTLYQATSEANNMSAVMGAKVVYETEMEECARSYVAPERLEDQHRSARDAALQAFRSKRKMGGEELAATYEERLLMDLDNEYQKRKVRNERNNFFRITSTPMLLLGLVVIGYMLSMIGGIFGLPVVGASALAIVLGSLVLVAFWAYSRFTGNVPYVAERLDDAADTLKLVFSLFLRNRAPPAPVHHDDKSR